MDYENSSIGQLKTMKRQIKSEAHKILDRAEEAGRSLTDGEADEVDGLIAELEDVQAEIENRYGPDTDDADESVGRQAFQNYEGGARLDGRDVPSVHTERERTMDNDNDLLDPETRDMLNEFARTGRVEERAGFQSVGTAGEGGVLATTGFDAAVFEIQDQTGGLTNTNARIFETERGEDLKQPVVADVSNRASIVGEGSTTPGTTNVSLHSIKYSAFKFQAGPIRVSRELTMDARTDAAGIITGQMANRISRAVNEDYAVGAGSTEPEGIVNATTGAVSIAAGSSNLDLDTLRSLFFSLDPSYRRRGEWAVSDDALQAVMELEDSDGRPLVQPSLQEGQPSRLFDRPMHVVQDLPSINTSSQIPILFGAMDAFGIRRVRGVELVRLDELYQETDEIGFISRFRTDSKVRYSSTVPAADRPIRGLATT